jgi:hypothetical protein
MNMEVFEKTEKKEHDLQIKERVETSPEQNTDIEKEANEIVAKIDKNFESVFNNQNEIQQIDEAVEFEDESIKNNIKIELGLEEKLNELNTEAQNSKEEAKSKISEITGLDKQEILELSEFSKRYSNFYRKEIAHKIKHLRSLQQSKLKEKPLEIESLHSSIATDEVLKEKTKEEKLNTEEVQKNLEAERNKLNLEINELKENLHKRKNSFMYKIQKRFISSSMEISEESVAIFKSEGLTKDFIKEGLYRKDFEIAELIHNKKNDFKNVDALLGEAREEMQKQIDLLKTLEDSIQEKYEAIEEAEDIITSDVEIQEIEKTIADFYHEMAFQKNKIESEKKERSVEQISKEKDVLFCHAIRLSDVPKGWDSFAPNNQLVDTHKLTAEHKIKMILGIEPTISVSTIDKEHQILVNTFGLILKEGTVLSAYNKDAGTLVDKSIYNRKSKHDDSLKTSTIQSDIETNIEKAVTSKADHNRWNELVVENPKAAGLFYQINMNKEQAFFSDISIGPYIERFAYKMSETLDLPLYIIDGNTFFKKDEATGELKEVSKEDILSSGRDISKSERVNYIGEIVDTESFETRHANIRYFREYKNGKELFIESIDSGKNLNIEIEKIEKDLQRYSESKYQYIQTQELYKLYGLMEECKKVANIEIYEKARSIIKRFGNMDTLKEFVSKRVDENDNFKYLMEDVPSEIRKKMKELNNSEMSEQSSQV